MAVARDAHVAGDDADDFALGTELGFDGGKARIDLDAQRFGLLREPAAELAETDDVVAVIAHQRRHDEVRNADAADLRQIVEPVVAHFGRHRRAERFPIGDELVERDRIDDGAGKNMRADLRALLDDADGGLAARCLRELLQADRGGEPGWPCADDHDVELHAFARVAHGARLCVARICTVNGGGERELDARLSFA